MKTIDNDAWTPDAVRALGVTTDVETAGAILGIGRSKAYALAKQGQFPVRILRVGRSYVVPVPAILQLLGLDSVA
ncbi:helix-turn-helix domain-containing protein [Micromonospora sp. ALFpr18c]|uniref:helix-turn-helix domain-containing protein n=1 Tax=Micromonospora sp. ALFpr18c TaxID=1458665 RepID=UPI00124B9E3C|nr:helix-turn-helix domain-containing protein [Micromonospora sp. ALFpr18c]KAB1943434.1 helix-turn-helix domain-containing protein [Micromonospora sp. ALFpr18c]